MRYIFTIFVLIFFSLNISGCNTITGTVKGVVEDVRSVIPGI
tara:strand:+ start:59 stop:184 length:126 start_codon:yes stop_codon:yes gene_type:complete